MANRLANPAPQFLTNSGQPNTGGSLAFYTTGTTTLATVYTNRSLGIAAQNPLPLDSAGRMPTDCFLDPAVTYKVILNDVNGVPIWTKDPVVDFAASINASLQVTAGNPNSQLAGTAGTVGGASASMAFDITNNLLYIATTTGTAATAVWTVVASALTANEDVITAASYTVVIGDVGRIKTANSGSATAWTLPAASTIGAGKFFGIKNIGAGLLTLTPTGADELEDSPSWVFAENEGALVYCTGSGWRFLASELLGTSLAEVTVPSATTCNILGAGSEFVAISGTTTITSFGTGANRRRLCRATGAFLITYNATSLILPGAANITTATGDTFEIEADASSNARMLWYQRATPVVTLTDGATPALDASMGGPVPNVGVFHLVSTQNPTIAVPGNPANDQRIIIAFTASGGGRTLALNTGAGGFIFGADIAALSATTSGKVDYIGAIYDATAAGWRVLSYTKGF
jgi:hypothetical protein